MTAKCAMARLVIARGRWQVTLKSTTIPGALIALLFAPSPAFAWGYESHEIIATIAHAELTQFISAKVDAILGTDLDIRTGSDMASFATWADGRRSAERGTAAVPPDVLTFGRSRR